MDEDGLIDEEDFSLIEETFGENNEFGDGNHLSATSAIITRKRKPLKKAPNAPKRFKSAYICFVAEKMDDVKKRMAVETKV